MNADQDRHRPLLSFCMPTYNRAPLLEHALGALLSQILPEAALDIEVVVVDNASPDSTSKVIEQAGLRWPHISLRSVRNLENIGPDRNFLKAVDLAQGEFVFLISDDDLLLPGAVSKLLELMHQHSDFDGFSLNARTFRQEPTEKRPAWFSISEDRVLHDKSEVLGMLETSIGFMSILAFRKSRLAERLSTGYYEDKIGSNFLQAFLFLDALAESKGFVIVAEPLLAQRAENSMFDNYFRIFVTGINAVLIYAEEVGYSKKVIEQVKAKNLVDVRHFVSSVRIYGHGEQLWPSRPDAIRRLFQMYGFRPYLWLVVVPLMFFPRSLSPLVFKLRRLLGRRDVELA